MNPWFSRFENLPATEVGVDALDMSWQKEKGGNVDLCFVGFMEIRAIKLSLCTSERLSLGVCWSLAFCKGPCRQQLSRCLWSWISECTIASAWLCHDHGHYWGHCWYRGEIEGDKEDDALYGRTLGLAAFLPPALVLTG